MFGNLKGAYLRRKRKKIKLEPLKYRISVGVNTTSTRALDLLADTAIERVACKARTSFWNSEGTSPSPVLKKLKKEELYENHDSYNWNIPPEIRYITYMDEYDGYPPPGKRRKVSHLNYNFYTVPKTSLIAEGLWEASNRRPIGWNNRVSRYPPSPTSVVLPQPPSPVYLHEQYRKYHPTRHTVYEGPEDIIDREGRTTGKFANLLHIDKTTKDYLGGKGNVEQLSGFSVKYLYKKSSTVYQLVGRVAFCDVTTYYDQYEKPAVRRGTSPGAYNNILQRDFFKKQTSHPVWWYCTSLNRNIFPPPPSDKIRVPTLTTHVFEESEGELEVYKFYRYKPTIVTGYSLFSKNEHIPKYSRNKISFGRLPSHEHLSKYWEEWQSRWPYSIYDPEEEKVKYLASRRFWIYQQLMNIWVVEN
jgi:hypothetical protein